MDAQTFDSLVAEATRRPSRRAALRLLAGGIFGGLVALRGATARAQRADGDGDGLYDDDEVQVYGTNPFNPNTDGDGFDDGAEVYYGTNPLVNDVTINGDGNLGGADPGPGGTIGLDCQFGELVCDGFCVQPLYDANNCGSCGVVCAATDSCMDGFCAAGGIIMTCFVRGTPCDVDGQCCAGSLCCFDGGSLRLECLDVTARGGVCPG